MPPNTMKKTMPVTRAVVSNADFKTFQVSLR
jgi:hypothetical protein